MVQGIQNERRRLSYVDLFCGIGGFRVAAERVCAERRLDLECVFSSDIDTDSQAAYEANFGHRPTGDITQVAANDVPDHDVLFAGFPCQAFSIIGQRKGFEDVRGTLFFDIARILDAKRPQAFVLENVKQLRTHDKGRTLQTIMRTLEELGYQAQYRMLNALDFGLPHKRERIFIVGFREPRRFDWPVPSGAPPTPLKDILDKEAPPSYQASERIQQSRLVKRVGKPDHEETTIWHENKGGNVSAHPFSCALRAGASYNYLLVNGKRRLTEREMLRLQGFPDDYKIVRGYTATRRQADNSVAVPCVTAILHKVIDALEREEIPSETFSRPFLQTALSFDSVFDAS
jgi:DNA (cytosine-5)-methyltransferase 1